MVWAPRAYERWSSNCRSVVWHSLEADPWLVRLVGLCLVSFCTVRKRTRASELQPSTRRPADCWAGRP